MDEIKFFLKFGERKHLEDLQKGNLFFSNAQTFRYYEEKLFINTYCKLPENVSFLGFSLYDKDLRGPTQIVVDRTTAPISIKAVKI